MKKTGGFYGVCISSIQATWTDEWSVKYIRMGSVVPSLIINTVKNASDHDLIIWHLISSYCT
jgi:hypothetical protein